MVRIRRFGIIRTANLVGMIYLLLSLIIIGVVVLIGLAAGPMEFTDSLGRRATFEVSPAWLLLSLVYGIVGWLLTALFCLIYNLAAAITGGVEVQLEGDGASVAPPDAPPAA